ncbi:MAG TPA: hypothetical protein VFZ09_31895 [Archangium sp.]|nr:hypothetical protein [Archangium sp.]HEX5750871.1 hypothetical protein [Archangium sp.]
MNGSNMWGTTSWGTPARVDAAVVPAPRPAAHGAGLYPPHPRD